MLTETRPELKNFSQTWQDKLPEQVIEEISSYSLESKRKTDPYPFLINSQGELYSPTARCRVKDVVVRDTEIGELEYQALGFIERWAAGNVHTPIVWISPPAEGVYPTSKVIVSEVEEQSGVKVLFNRAIVLDIDKEACFKLAQNLENFSSNRPLLNSIDSIRSHPLVLNPGLHWTYILEELVEGLSLTDVRLGEDRKVKKEALKEATSIYQELITKEGVVDMGRMISLVNSKGMIGEFVVSCPVNMTAFKFLSEHSQYYCKNCPICHNEINTEVRPGGKCPKCGASRECA